MNLWNTTPCSLMGRKHMKKIKFPQINNLNVILIRLSMEIVYPFMLGDDWGGSGYFHKMILKFTER